MLGKHKGQHLFSEYNITEKNNMFSV